MRKNKAAKRPRILWVLARFAIPQNREVAQALKAGHVMTVRVVSTPKHLGG
jgi:predicted phosphoribosyltransferase